ncbi:MAG TPA: AsmA-like C-terminal region-containing protein [Gemmatimonadaceae bacterium]|nr:AsmA-like C-terminal region-containing protein [Gemmatimonadaceae bacterium]
MNAPRKLAVGAAAVIGALLLVLLLVPFLLRDRIAARVQAEIAQSVNAQVRWGGVGLSLLRDFPNVTLRLDDLSVAGVEKFEGDTLVAMRQFRIVLDLGSVVRNLRRGDAIVVREVELRQPAVRLLVLEDGATNWDIVRAQPDADTAGTSGALALSLRELSVRDGSIRFDDRQSDLAAALAGLEVALDGDFTQDRFELGTRVRASEVSLRFAGVPYLTRVSLALDTDVTADMGGRRFTFTDDQLRLNDLVLAFAGSVGLGPESTALDLTFSTPSTDFAHILSLVPAVYARDFESLQTSGRMSVSGRVQGEYGPKAFPALALRAKVEDGTFRYPDLPLPARDIALDLAIDNAGGHVDSTIVRLERFHVVLGGRPVDARLVLRTPVSDPDVELKLTGSVDLADVGRTIKLEGVDELSGLVAANAAMRTRKSWVDAGQYERVSASGTMDVSRLALRTAALPHALAIDSARLRFTPRRAELASFAARIGSSDVRATGAIDNLLGFVLRGEELRGEATVASNRFDLNEWQSDDSLKVVPVPPNVDFALRATAREVVFGKLQLANARGGLRVKDQRVTIDDFRTDMLGGAVIANGFYETTVSTRPTFDLDVAVDSVDIPTAFASLVTVQRLAPIARYARGSVSANLDLAGALGGDMTPLFDVLTGKGAFQTASVAIEGFPALVKLADVLRIEQLRNPTMRALQAAFRVENGRVHVQPFDVRVGELAATITGSNGIDQTLDYDVALAVPTSLLGAGASQAITSLASRAGRTGIDLGAAEVVSIAVDVTGTVTDPTVRPAFSGTAGSIRDGVKQAVQTEVESRVAAVEQRVDSAAEEARRRARAEAERLVAQAEEGAAAVRLEADSVAARVRREGYEKADALVARATNPVARVAAQTGADRLRRETDAQAERIVREADARATALVEEARRRGDGLVPPKG